MCPPGSGKYSLYVSLVLIWVCALYGLFTSSPLNGLSLLYGGIVLIGLGYVARRVSRYRRSKRGKLPKMTGMEYRCGDCDTPWKNPSDYDDAA